MKTLSSPLPIPTDHNPFDFYSYRGKQGLERQESVQPKTWSGNLEFKSKVLNMVGKSFKILPGGRSCASGSKTMENCLLWNLSWWVFVFMDSAHRNDLVRKEIKFKAFKLWLFGPYCPGPWNRVSRLPWWENQRQLGGPKSSRTKKLNSRKSLGDQTTWRTNRIQEVERERKYWYWIG